MTSLGPENFPHRYRPRQRRQTSQLRQNGQGGPQATLTPKAETVRLSVTLPAAVKTALDRYAELFASTYGEPVDATALIPHMLATFMDRDRAFRKTQAASGRYERGIAATSAAISNTNDTAGEGSPSR